MTRKLEKMTTTELLQLQSNIAEILQHRSLEAFVPLLREFYDTHKSQFGIIYLNELVEYLSPKINVDVQKCRELLQKAYTMKILNYAIVPGRELIGIQIDWL